MSVVGGGGGGGGGAVCGGGRGGGCEGGVPYCMHATKIQILVENFRLTRILWRRCFFGRGCKTITGGAL